LAVTGTIFIQLSGAAGIERGPSPLLGNMLIIAAVICEALFMILGKSVVDRISPLAISAVVSVIGAVLFLPFSLYELKVTEYHLGHTSLAEWGLIVYLGVVVTVSAFLLMYQALSILPAGKAGVMTSVLPISSVMLSVLILGEAFSVYHLAGLIIILLAIGLVSKDAAQKEGQKITG
jgi:drug/metabolite transporter (DMT)-like permease